MAIKSWFSWLRKSSNSKKFSTRSLRFEQLEDRRMLATMADIAFLVDESGSDGGEVKDWLADTIAGNTSVGVTSLADQLNAAGVDDVQYGLIGFGETPTQGNTNHSNSHLLIEGNSPSLLIDPNDPNNDNDTSDALTEEALAKVFTDLAVSTAADSVEDGWDAIEHAIAEYNFRDGSVPVLVLVQADEGRLPLNETATHDGIIAALDSKNVILNVMAAGEVEAETQLSRWNPLFDLAPYEVTAGDFANQRVLGVESDRYGFDDPVDPVDDTLIDAISDRQHDYYLVDLVSGDEVTTLPSARSDALQVSFNGSNTGASGMVGSGKSILIGENITGGIGGTLITDMQYRAKSVAFDASDDLRGDPSANPFDIGTGTVFDSEILGDNESLSGFSFGFFGTHSQFRIHADDVITMDGPDGASTISELTGPNVDLSHNLPSQTDPIIAVLWDDLKKDINQSEVLWKVTGTGSEERLIVQWNDFEYAQESGTHEDALSFQSVLYADGHIKMNYFDLDTYNTKLTVNETGGISATVGIWGSSSDTLTVDAGKFVPGLHSIGGETTSSQFGETPDSYVRMAWDTGGAAWDASLIVQDEISPGIPISSDVANTLRDKSSRV